MHTIHLISAEGVEAVHAPSGIHLIKDPKVREGIARRFHAQFIKLQASQRSHERKGGEQLAVGYLGLFTSNALFISPDTGNQVLGFMALTLAGAAFCDAGRHFKAANLAANKQVVLERSYNTEILGQYSAHLPEWGPKTLPVAIISGQST